MSTLPIPQSGPWGFLPHQGPFSLSLCLESGQAFGWRQRNGLWIGSIRNLGLALHQTPKGVEWQASHPARAEKVICKYFALNEDPNAVTQHFPVDSFLTQAVHFCRGLRVLRQDPWECLAGFILSSTKQIVHIQQIWRKLSERWGPELSFPHGLHAFPEASVLAKCSETELRECGMGFRAPNLLAAAQAVDSGSLTLDRLQGMTTPEARTELVKLRGVGEKIANCVLLFSLSKADAFPVDTWILKTLKQVYFRRGRRVTPKKLHHFATTYFGPYGGHAQQYLFHYARMHPHLVSSLSKTAKRVRKTAALSARKGATAASA